jgi:hypothetical protein
MKYAVEMGSGAMTYITISTKIGSGTEKLIGGCTDRQHGDLISLLLFLQNKKSRLKIRTNPTPNKLNQVRDNRALEEQHARF